MVKPKVIVTKVQVKITSKEEQKYDVEVVQKNKNPAQFYKPYCEYIEEQNIILVSVPSCESNVLHQINNWEDLTNSYASAINKAIRLNKKIVLVPELGEGLLWNDYMIPKAAREALEKIDKCDDDFEVVFCINESRYKLWDTMMKFD